MRKIQKAFLIASLIGIFILIFLSAKIEPPTKLIKDLTNSSLDKEVIIEGNIIKTRSYNNDTFHILTVQDSSGKIEVIFNSKNPERRNINSSFNYTIKGKLSKYNDTLQIAAEEIRLLR